MKDRKRTAAALAPRLLWCGLAAAAAGAAYGQAPASGVRQEVAAAEPAANVPSASAATLPAALPPQSAAQTEPDGGARAAITRGSSTDTLDLGTTSITGSRELPKVLYIVPWKRSDLGEIVGRPVNTLLDEVLAPIDPDVFERHIDYYAVLHPEAAEPAVNGRARRNAQPQED